MARSNRRVHQLATITRLSPTEVVQRLRAVGIEVTDEHSLIPKARHDVALKTLGINPISGKLLQPPKPQRVVMRMTGDVERHEGAEAQNGKANSSKQRPPKGAPSKEDRREIVGHRSEVMAYLTARDVEQIHQVLVSEFKKSRDPIDPPGVRSNDLLESAVFRAHTSLGGELKYPTIEMAATAYLHAIIANHAFHNGNKRTALVAMLVFLDLNSYVLEIGEDELFDYLIRIASHDIGVSAESESRADAEMIVIAKWVSSHSRPLTVGEHPLKFHQLRSILNNYGCTFTNPKKGNRINIQRGDRKVQIYYRNEGTDVQLNTISMIRRELGLTEAEGYDSTIFYNADERIPDFILKYRRTLQRLAKA